ncbi:MAG: DegV family protein [bacterium]|nr:DegV family protein [bacterium]
MKYQIVSDSSCDIDKAYVAEKGIEVVPFYVTFDEVNYFKEGVEVDHEEFYGKMINEHLYPKSSLPAITDYVDVFTKYAKENIPVICTTITTKFSGSYQSACNAKEIVLETYKDAVITVIDSTLNTSVQNVFVKEAVRMREDGVSYEDCIANLERIRSTGRIIFTIENIDYLKKGGRIGKLLKLAGSTLGIRPIIIFEEGEIAPGGISRSRKKAKQKVLDVAKEYFAKNNLNPEDYSFSVGTGIDFDEAEELRDQFEEVLGIKNIPINQIGVTVGTHTGPHPIGIGFIKKYDR